MKNVLILLSTYNGEKYIEEQIQSYLVQKGIKCDLLVRDDGSSDATLSIIKKYADKFSKLRIIKGKNMGYAGSFMALIRQAYSLEQKYDYYALSDQDDVWLADKLYIATDRLSRFDSRKPQLYFSQTQLVDSRLNYIATPRLKLKCTFGESFVVFGATGCTEVFNYELLKIVSTHVKVLPKVRHDAWIYQTCLAFDGAVFFDTQPHILYRQHRSNVIGRKTAKKTWFRRFNYLFSKGKNSRLESTKDFYRNFETVLPDKHKKLLAGIVNYKTDYINRVKLLFNKDLTTKNVKTNLRFRIALLLGLY